MTIGHITNWTGIVSMLATPCIMQIRMLVTLGAYYAISLLDECLFVLWYQSPKLHPKKKYNYYTSTSSYMTYNSNATLGCMHWQYKQTQTTSTIHPLVSHHCTVILTYVSNAIFISWCFICHIKYIGRKQTDYCYMKLYLMYQNQYLIWKSSK